MDYRDQNSYTPRNLSSNKKFGETPLGKLITVATCTDKKEVKSLLEEKKRQIKEMQGEIVRAKTAEPINNDPNQMTKMKFFLMPNVRKSPVKALYKDNNVVVRSRSNSEKPLPEEADVFWYKLTSPGWKPETRQEATLTSIEGKLYLIGGVSRSINHDVNMLNPLSNRWEKLRPSGVEPDPRFGHSALEYKSKIIVFGGGTNFNTVHKFRECLNGIKVFYPNPSRWDYLKTSGTYISTRKYHSAAIIGKHMFVYGGLNQKNNLLDDCALLNLEKNTWKSIYLEGPKENAFQTSVSVINEDQKSYISIYHINQSSYNKVKKPGIYIFGGIGSDKQAHNKLWLVNIGQRPLIWEVIKTEGEGPSPRFLHSMIYNERSNHIIVFGGRIDVSQTSTYTCYNDVYLLCMQRLLWLKVRVQGDIPMARSGHCSAMVGNNMFIFGGVSNTCYCSSDIYILETENNKVKELIQQDVRKKQFMIEVENHKAKKIRQAQSSITKKPSKTFTRVSITPSRESYPL